MLVDNNTPSVVKSPGCATGQFAIRTFKAQIAVPPTSSDVFAVPDANVAFFFLVT